MESNYRFFKLTEISSQSALIPFATAPIEIESGYTAYVVSGGAVYIRLNFDKNHNLEVDILMTDLVEDLNNDQEDNWTIRTNDSKGSYEIRKVLYWRLSN